MSLDSNKQVTFSLPAPTATDANRTTSNEDEDLPLNSSGTPKVPLSPEAAPPSDQTPKAASLGNNQTADTNSEGSAGTAAEKANPRQPKSAIKLGARPRSVHCSDCNKDIPMAEWPNHRDRLRTVPLKTQTKSAFQRYVLSPLLNAIMWVIVNVFFREVAVVGQENIPKKGPVVFYGNHQNQFVDAIMMRACCGRPVRFIIAEKSMTRPVIGHFARLMDAVPVIRPQDVPSVDGKGKLIKTEGPVVRGEGTDFLASVRPGDVVMWTTAAKEKFTGQVLQVASDTELTLTRTVADEAELVAPVAWKLSRRIDHSEMYGQVYETLRTGGAIGIFPEGGSHDHTSLIPLKAGVALFTLGASERGIHANIIPCGLTYFYGHKFRSRAHIEFGKPQTVPTELTEKFATDKRGATGDLLKILDQALRGVTINVPDWSTLKFLHNFRRVYQPPGLLLETGDYLALTRRLAVITQEKSEEPDFQDFRMKIENYSDFCNALLVRDSQAATLSSLARKKDGEGQGEGTTTTNQGGSVSLRLLSRRIAMLSLLSIVLVPFLVVCGPIGVLCHVLAEAHAKTALSASTVKVVAADVKASYKMVLGFVFVPVVFSIISLVVGAMSDARTGLTVLVSMPVVMYTSVVIGREFVLELYATLPLVMSMLSKHKQFLKLHEKRCALVSMASSIVAKYDPELHEEMERYKQQTVHQKATRQASLFSLRHQSRINHRKAL